MMPANAHPRGLGVRFAMLPTVAPPALRWMCAPDSYSFISIVELYLTTEMEEVQKAFELSHWLNSDDD